jgi:hypothetical protein
MLPYPPSMKPGAAENSLLRVLGGVLAFLSILLTLLGIILHQRVPDLILAIIVGMFALRVFLLWLGEKPRHQQPIPGWSSMDPVRYPPPQGVQPIPSSPPPSLWLPPPYASVPMPSPAPVPGPSQQETWQYDDGENFTQQQRGNDHSTA